MSEPETIEMVDERVGIISRVASVIARVIGGNVDNEKTLVEKITDVAEREGMRFKKARVPYWANLVYDQNRIHMFKQSALDFGFQDTPVYGTWIAARAEQYVLDLLEEINSLDGRDLNYEGHSIKFKNPLYHGKTAEWSLQKAAEREDGIDLSIVASGRDGQIVIQCPEVNLRIARPKLRTEQIIPFSSDSVKARKTIEITQPELELFYKCLGKKPRQEIPMMYPASFIVSALLDISSTQSGKPEGALLGLDLRYYNQPGFGKIETLVRLKEEPREKGGMYHHVFEGLCVQEGRPILSGVARVFAKSKLE